MKERHELRHNSRDADFWERESVADHLDEVEDVEVQVKKPLSHTISVRISSEDLKALQLLAQAQGVGVTTMARMLLREVLREPGKQLFLQALDNDRVREEMEKLYSDAKVPPGQGEPELFVLPMDRLEALGSLISETVQALLTKALQGSAKVSPQDQLYRELAEKVKA